MLVDSRTGIDLIDALQGIRDSLLMMLEEDLPDGSPCRLALFPGGASNADHVAIPSDAPMQIPFTLNRDRDDDVVTLSNILRELKKPINAWLKALAIAQEA